jgi:hypothetical protein
VEQLLGLSSFWVRIFEAIEATTVVNFFQAFSKSELIQVVTLEHSLRAAFAGSCATAGGPAKQRAGNGLHVGMDISRLLTELVPDGHQQLTGDGNNRFGFANMCAESLKFSFPVGMIFDGHPGSFNHGDAQFTVGPSTIAIVPQKGKIACSPSARI